MAQFATYADKVLGASLTPETLWNLAPWSWAVDWFSNTGDVLHNLQSFQSDGLVMRYGYMMVHTIVKDTYRLSSSNLGNDSSSGVSPLAYVTETKTRAKANPYGFGASWNGLSPHQLAILGALGITR
jgi:hypothetical protein